jgi:drug/metabolite transporter (DMT)-like permease
MQDPKPATGLRKYAGIWWILSASVGFAAMGALVKLARVDLSASQVVFWRSIVIALIAHRMVHRQGTSLRPGAPGLMALRCVFGTLAMYCFFAALAWLPLGTATALLYTSPVFTVLLAGPLLGEQRGAAAFALVGLAFGGVLLILKPSLDADLFSMGVALLAGALAGWVYVIVRKLRLTDPPSRIVWWFAATGAAVMAPFAVFEGLPSSLEQWALVVGIGVTAGVGQMGMTQAYRVEQATVVGPFSYATVVLSMVVGALVFDEWPDGWSWLGTAVFVAAGVFLARGAGKPEAQAT